MIGSALLLADMAAVCAAGRSAPAAAIAADHVVAVHPATEATLLIDGRRAGAVGAAFANGVLANVLDFDDGHRLTKGHPGAIVIPAALAVAQLVDATPTRAAGGRRGRLRGRDPRRHRAARARSRLPRLRRVGRASAPPPRARACSASISARRSAALGLAEYHAPIAPMMRSCAEPRMTKDACAWGASLGVESALLAARGFTAVRGEFPDRLDGLGDLGDRWRLQELYIKAYPCCRWSQGAIAAALAGDGWPDARARRRPSRLGADVRGRRRARQGDSGEHRGGSVQPAVAAGQRAGARPVRRRRGARAVHRPAVLAMFERIEIEVDPELTAAFPARRLTAVEIELDVRGAAGGRPAGGRRRARRSGVGGAGGGQGRARLSVRRRPSVDLDGGLRDASPSQLLALLRRGAVAGG